MSSLEFDAPLRSSIEYLGGNSPVGMLSNVVVYALLGSAIGFQCANQCLNYLPAPAKYEGSKRFKWRNVVCSFLHALISGSASVYYIYNTPEIFDDLIYNHTTVCECLVAVSIGYFVYDFIDNITYRSVAESWAIILHHVTIFCCCGLSLVIQQYIGYSTVSLLAEVNSIFLHARQIMLMMNIPKSSMVYFINNIFNILTFILFRFGMFFWLSWWLYMNYVHVPTILISLACSGLVIMFLVNVTLFYRLITSDFLRKQTSDSKKEHKDILDMK